VELVEFLLARICEDEAEAVDNEDIFCRRVDDSEGKYWWECSYCRDGGWVAIDSEKRNAWRQHVATRHPTVPRVLAECQAKRAIVNTLDGIAAAAADTPGILESAICRGMARAMEEAVKMVAAVYGDHPDYREEWRA
jgi:hypothetical protein